MSSWVGVALLSRGARFRSVNFLKWSIGKRKVVERHGRCRVDTLAPSDSLVTSDKLSKAVFLSQRFVDIIFVKAGS